jgi:hypothetical protein
MARIVLTDATVTVNAVDLSQYIASVTINSTREVVDTTGFSTSGARTRIAGLQDNSVTLEFHQDFASGAVEATIFPLIGTTTTVVVKPTSAVVGPTNPSYTCTALVSEWTALSGTVGELSTASVSWPISGAITKSTGA